MAPSGHRLPAQAVHTGPAVNLPLALVVPLCATFRRTTHEQHGATSGRTRSVAERPRRAVAKSAEQQRRSEAVKLAETYIADLKRYREGQPGTPSAWKGVIARSELARYRRGDLSAPLARPERASLGTENNRALQDYYRMNFWEETAGKSAPFDEWYAARQRSQAQFERMNETGRQLGELRAAREQVRQERADRLAAKNDSSMTRDLFAGKSVLVERGTQGHYVIEPGKREGNSIRLNIYTAEQLGRTGQGHYPIQRGFLTHDQLNANPDGLRLVASFDHFNDALRAARQTDSARQGRLAQLRSEQEQLHRYLESTRNDIAKGEAGTLRPHNALENSSVTARMRQSAAKYESQLASVERQIARLEKPSAGTAKPTSRRAAKPKQQSA